MANIQPLTAAQAVKIALAVKQIPAIAKMVEEMFAKEKGK